MHIALGATLAMFLTFAFGCGETDDRLAAFNGGPSQDGIDVGKCIPQETQILTPAGLRIEFEGRDGTIPLNQLFALVVTVTQTPEDLQLSILVDATMPAHGHGMNTIPTIESEEGTNQFVVSNMNLHMPGEWELSILLMYGENAEQVRAIINCSESA